MEVHLWNINTNTNKNSNTNTNKTDNSVAGTVLPATGAKVIIIPAIILIVLAYVSYNKYMKYKLGLKVDKNTFSSGSLTYTLTSVNTSNKGNIVSF